MISALISNIDYKSYSGLIVSTSSKFTVQLSRLPDKKFNQKLYCNFLITNPDDLLNLLVEFDGKIKTILIDVERKQPIDLMKIAMETVKESVILPYKPNDVTVEAADQLVLHFTGVDLRQKKVLIYGTGNLAFKLALRLLEREADVLIVGRNQEKVKSIVEVLNLVKPRFSEASAYEFDFMEDSTIVDGFVSFVSGEQVVPAEWCKYIRPSGFAIDGGIGNFEGSFIAKALEDKIAIVRLDVRLGNLFLEASVEALSGGNSFFTETMGVKELNGYQLVAGGIIGEAGSIIVDAIQKPTQVIGVANGYGGLKSEEQFTELDRRNLHNAKETLLSNI